MFKLRELADLIGGEVKGNGDLKITGYCSLDSPQPQGISYMEKGRDASKLSDIMLGALVTTQQLAHNFTDVIMIDNPRLAFITIMEKFLALQEHEAPASYIHESAVVHESAQIDESALVGANAVIEAGVVVGARSEIGAGVFVGRNCKIGDDSVIHPNATIYHGTEIGDTVVIHSGVVVGSDGLGFVPTKEGHRKFPQVGTVLIENNVEIGSNSCIDRAALDQTIIHSGTKIDNLVQLAHGVRIGSNTVIAAQTGISGSTRVGNWCIIGGQAGFQGHITIGDQSIVAAQSGVFSDLPFKSKVSGYPAKPHAQSLKVLALTFKLPELVEKVKTLEIELDLMRGELKGKAKRERERKRPASDIPDAEA